MTNLFISRLHRAIPLVMVLGLITFFLASAPSSFAAGAPTISGLSPTSGFTTGGTSITISGTDFQVPGFSVKIDGITVSTTPGSNTSVTVSSQAHAAGTVTVVLHTDLGDASASFTYIDPMFTVLYDGNGNTGGTSPIDGKTYPSGATVVVAGQNTLVKTDHTFGGWQTGGGASPLVTYSPGGSFSILRNTTLTAVWNPTPTPTPSGTSSPSPTPTPTPSGTSSPSPTPTPTSTTRGKTVFTITYLGNTNTTGLPPAPTVGFGFVTLASNTGLLVKNSFGFDGWNTKVDGSGISYRVASSYSLIANVTLYALWNPNIIYTITYDGNGSTGGTAPPPTVGIGTVTLGTNSGSLVRTDTTFYGWNTKADGSGTSYRTAGSFILSQNVTLFAVFIPLVVGKNPPSLIVNGKIVNTAPPKKIALNQIVPVHQQFLTSLPKNASGFELYENGKFILAGKSNSANLKSLVGPKDRVDVVAVGKDGSKSTPSPVRLSKDPISLANINFNTDSYQFVGPATKILDEVALVMLKHGYTKLEIWGYVDTQGSKASWIILSKNRALAVKNYMTKKLLGTGITIKNAGRAQTQAVGNNNTAAGRALNRRVEIRVS